MRTKLLVMFGLLLIGMQFGFGETRKIPDNFWKQSLFIRDGVDDFQASVEDTLLNKKFIINTALDGTVVTARYGIPTIEVNSVVLSVEILNNGNLSGTIYFYLSQQKGYVLIDRMRITTPDGSRDISVTEFTDKLQFYAYFGQLIQQ